MSRAACGRPSALLFSAIFFNFLGSLKSSVSTAFNDSVVRSRFKMTRAAPAASNARALNS